MNDKVHKSHTPFYRENYGVLCGVLETNRAATVNCDGGTVYKACCFGA